MRTRLTRWWCGWPQGLVGKVLEDNRAQYAAMKTACKAVGDRAQCCRSRLPFLGCHPFLYLEVEDIQAE